jgi:hypothetical protein
MSIAYPFLYPTGTDTGVEATSSFNASPYTVPSNFATHCGSWLSDVPYALNFDHIKLQVNIGPLIEANTAGQTTRENTLLQEIATAVDLILTSGLKCILSLNLTGFVTGYSAASFLDGITGTKFTRYKNTLQDIVTKFAGYDPTLLAIEPFSRPPNTTDFAGNYPSMLLQLYQIARQTMKNHTVIMTSPGFSSPDTLVTLDPSTYDKNTIWSFHWFPLSSIQGSNSDPAKYFDGYDWEKRPDERSSILAQVTARVNADASINDKASKINSVMAALDVMFTQGRDYIEQKVLAVRNWQLANSINVMCGEYGITGDNPVFHGMPETSRIANTRAINLTLAKYGMTRTTAAVDSDQYHVPGNAAAPKTLDNITSVWQAALMPIGGWINAIKGTSTGPPPPPPPPPPPNVRQGVGGATGHGSATAIGQAVGGTQTTIPNVDLDFVSDIYDGGTIADIVNPAGVRKSNTGIATTGGSGGSLRFIAKNATHPALYTINDSIGQTLTDSGPVSALYPNSRIFKTTNSGTRWLITFTENLTVGETIVVQAAIRAPRNPDGSIIANEGGGAQVSLTFPGGGFGGGSGGEGWYTNDIRIANPTFQVNHPPWGTTGSVTTFLGSTPLDAQGYCVLTFSHVVQSATGTGLFVNLANPGAGTSLSVGAVQVIRNTASGNLPFRDVGTTTLVEAGDAYSLRTGSNIYNIMQNSQGAFGMEIYQISFSHIGMGGYNGSTAQTLLQCGGSNVFRTGGATAMGSAATTTKVPIGVGGWRGIVRMAVSWNGSNWSMCVNGGDVVTGTSGLTHSGVINLMQLNGTLRRITGTATRPTDAQLKEWTRVHNKILVRTGTSFTSLSATAATQTYLEEFDSNSALETIPNHASEPWGNWDIGPMLDAYWDQTDTTHKKTLKPRAHFYTASPNGNSGAGEQINGELEWYHDPQSGSGITTHEWAVTKDGRASFFRGTTGLTSSLTSAQQAFVGTNPQTGSKYSIYSWMMTTYMSSPSTEGYYKGGYTQKFGIFSARCQFPTGPDGTKRGGWGAFWLYNWATTAELDIQEQYGLATPYAGTSVEALNLHWDHFADGFTSALAPYNVGYDLSQDLHDYMAVWFQGVVYACIDGEIVTQSHQGGTFDNGPQAILFNYAIQGGSSAPDSTSLATMPWITWIDRCSAYQFGGGVAPNLGFGTSAGSGDGSGQTGGTLNIADSTALYTALQNTANGGKTLLLAADTDYGAFVTPACDFTANPVTIRGQSGTTFRSIQGAHKGINWDNFKINPQNETAMFIWNCSNVNVTRVSVDSGQALGSPDNSQGFSIRNSQNVSITGQGNSAFDDVYGCGNGLAVIGPCDTITLKNITIGNNGTDGIIFNAITHMMIDGIYGHDFYSDIAGGDHPDFIQGFGTNDGITVQNCGWQRGVGDVCQGYFFEDTSDVTIQRNWLYGGLFNSISFARGSNCLIDDNFMIGFDDYGSDIIVRGAYLNATVTNNYSGNVTNYAADGTNVNFQPATLPGSNTLIGTTTNGVYTQLDAWLATHPTARRRG